MTKGAVKSSYLRTSNYLVNMCVMGSIHLAIQGGDSFLPLQFLSGLLMACVPFWLNVHPITKVFSFTTTFVERIFGLEGLVLHYTSPSVVWFVWSCIEGKPKARAQKIAVLESRFYPMRQ